MNPIRATLALALFFATCFFTWQLWQVEQYRRSLKADQVELSHIKYGLFNVDEWKVVAAEIVERKVNEFQVTPENRNEIIKRTEELLHELIDEVEAFMREENSNSIGGFFRQLGSEIFVPFEKVKKGIPEYAETLVDRLNDPKTRHDIKDFIVGKIDEYADRTVGVMDYAQLNAILAEHGCLEKETCVQQLREESAIAKRESRRYIFGLATCVLALILLIFTGSKGAVELLSFTLTAFALLAGGVTLPMIDIEATIESFQFILLGEPVTFENQVLFFQSKSILEVVEVLLQNGDAPLIIVALLIFSFSILMPLIKLILTASAQIRGVIPKSRIVRFFLFRSAKWSMADVMVVALFMAYIGFSGVINSQLTQIERNSGSIEVFTTDNSTLQLGFYLFTAYALVGLLMGYTFAQSSVAKTEISNGKG